MAARLWRRSSSLHPLHHRPASFSYSSSSLLPPLTARRCDAAPQSSLGLLICKGYSNPMASRHGITVDFLGRWNYRPPWMTVHLRFITQSQKEKKLKKKMKKKKTKRCIIKKLKHLRHAAKVKKAGMNHEEKLLARIERVKLKIDALQKALESYKMPDLPEPDHDPESLTEEELNYLKRLGYKHKNYMILGVRGVFGGVVLNMHLHWKKHQLVKIRCKNFTKEEIDETGEQLARLSGGIVVDVQNGSTIVMYRGRNYRRPVDMTPKNTLSKRKALFKAKFEQSLKSMNKNLVDLETELVLYREHKAKQEAGLFSVEPVGGYISSWSDTEGENDDDDDESISNSDNIDKFNFDSDSGWGSTSSDLDSDSEESKPERNLRTAKCTNPLMNPDSDSCWGSTDSDADVDSGESKLERHSSSVKCNNSLVDSDSDSCWGSTDSDADVDSGESKL